MSFRRNYSINSRLFLLVLSCVLPAVFMAGALILFEYHRAQEQLIRDSIATARAMVSVVDGYLASTTASLTSLATSPYLTANNFSEFHHQAQQVLQNQNADNIVLSDLNGKQYINTLRPYGDGLPQRTASVHLKRMAHTGQPMVTDLFIGPLLGKPVIVVGVPVFKEDRYLYSLSAGLFAERFKHILQQQNLPTEWLGVILDSKGTIVARSMNMKRYVGQKGPQEALSYIADAREGSFETTSLDGVPVVTVFSRSRTSDWTVAIAVPKKSITGELQNSIFWLFLAAGGLLLSSLVIAARIGGRISLSINRLKEPALALGAGNAVFIPPLYLKEAQEVGASLIKASEMLLRAQHQASHDALTGLMSKTLFQELVEKQLAICERNGEHLSVLYIDLDGFKSINDVHGHAAGDRLLQQVANRLSSGIRKADAAARLGGDEFAVLLISATEAVSAVAQKLVELLSQSYLIENRILIISASIGVASFPMVGNTSKALLHAADNAMYEAKAKGKRQVVVAREGL